ncbi:class I SAM-dependent methyltransferase [Patescibacteria group bacterium]|nr:class I SAM-dependent methyltransferase [Patescibacteria group bacterium]
MKLKRQKNGVGFWNREYSQAEHLALSTNPSEDMLKFLRHLERESGRSCLNPTMSALDMGCGNGRNLHYLARTYGMRGVGYDISDQAVRQARIFAEGTALKYETRSIADSIPLPDSSQMLVLDMMASHVLTHEEREREHEEILRVLRPNGWFFLKTFLLDEDRHAKRLLKENPGTEAGSYIHPVIGVAEYVFSEEDIVSLVEKRFTVHKVLKSHRHLQKDGPGKRRSISIYAQKT